MASGDRIKQDNKRYRPQSDPDSSVEWDPFSGDTNVGIVISKRELASIIEESVNKAVSTSLNEKLNIELGKIRAYYDDKIEKITTAHETRIFDLENKLDIVENKIKENTDSMANEAKDEPGDSGLVNMQLKKQANDLEQYSRRNSIKIVGLMKEPPRVNPFQRKGFLCSWFNRNMNQRVHPSSIEAAHPLGPIVNKKQTIIIKFNDRDVRDALVDSRKRLKGKGYVIHEDITKVNLTFMNRIRNTPGIADVWFYKGKVFCKAENQSRKYKVDLTTDIQSIISG